ncbi:MAG: DUF4294 domain-containing protein [Flavobacteriales bacterium]|nr:DUF4294 domain-containing protein [Flavobacteriales bacterium]
MLIRVFLTGMFLISGVLMAGAQTDSAKKSWGIVEDGDIVRIAIDGKDTIWVYDFEEVVIKDFSTPEGKEAYRRLVYNVRKTLPYAKLAAFRLQMMEDNLQLLTTEKERNQYIKATEKAIKEEFMATLKLFTRSQGKLLLKLIHRETGKTSYEILKYYRGSAETFYWSAFARFYDASLKDEYDPILDYQIEMIIKQYKLE